MDKKGRYIFLGIFCIALTGLQINSSVWFRLKLADFYKTNRQYAEAIRLYEKILTKNNTKRVLNDKIFSRINFDLGYLYNKVNLVNPAVEFYARGSAGFPRAGIEDYCFKNHFDYCKLLLIGSLEAGELDKAIECFESIKRFYPKASGAEKYFDVATLLKKENLLQGDKNFYFLIGDAYIQNQLFDEARAFFTKRILDYGIEPVQVLAYLQKKYAKNTEIIEKVWGKNIYVTLEDFEAVQPRLFHWLSSMGAKVNSHHIADEVVYKGCYSEFFDIAYALDKEYAPSGSTYLLVKLVNISLKATNPNMGLRLFIKSIGPSGYNLRLNIIYPASEITGTCGVSFKQDAGDGWEEYRVENLFENAKTIASDRNWGIDGMRADKIIIDTGCFSTKFFVDEIELYLKKEDKCEQPKQL